MPLVPASLIDPLWVEFAAQIGAESRPEYDPAHPLGCHRHRVDDRTVFDCLIAALVHGSGYERVAVPGCSDRTIRRRLIEWAERGITKDLLRRTLAGYDRMLGLDLDDLSVDASITKSPVGGEVSGRSPVDRGKQGTKRSVVTDAAGPAPAPGRRGRQRPRLPAAGTHPGPGPRRGRALARGGLRAPGRRLRLGQDLGPAAHPGLPAPHRDQRQTLTDPGRATLGRGAHPLLDERVRQAPPQHDRQRHIVEFYLFLAAAITAIRRLINTAHPPPLGPTPHHPQAQMSLLPVGLRTDAPLASSGPAPQLDRVPAAHAGR